MKFLLDLGIKEKTIEGLIKKYDESVLDIVKIESDNVEEVINYFKEIGITEIDNLLIFDITIFTKDIEIVKEAFESKNISEVVPLINKDITYITNI